MNDLQTQLREFLLGRVCVVGVGNVELGDDGFGVRLAEELGDSRFTNQNRHAVIAAPAAERYLETLSGGRFDSVLFLDAVEFGAEPGAVVLLNASEMAARFPQVSTHKLSLGLLARMIEAGGLTKARLLGVQPGSLHSGVGLSSAVQRTLAVLRRLFREVLEMPAVQTDSEPSVVHSPQPAIAC